MHTLHEFFYQTKAASYLITVVLLLGFVGFWRFLVGREGHG